jgi:hypothetical protein
MSDRYVIECKVCEVEVSLKFITNDDFKCPVCGTLYNSEDGVFDKVEAEEMYQLYRGAKIAGLIKDEETYEEFYHD